MEKQSGKLKLGDKVSFQKYLVRKNYSCCNPSINIYEAKQLNGAGELPEQYTRYSEKDNKKVLTGIVCGARTIKYKGFSRYVYGEGYEFVMIEHKKVYLVATNMNSFHRVPEEFILAIEKAEGKVEE